MLLFCVYSPLSIQYSGLDGLSGKGESVDFLWCGQLSMQTFGLDRLAGGG